MTDWREIQGRFSSFDGIRIHYRQLIPRDATCYTVMLVHGFGEHAGRYGHLYNLFVPKGYEFYAPDLRGHGLSEGQRGHVMRFDDYLDDLEVLRKKIDSERPSKCGLKGGNILIGHSMGGLIALEYALDHPEGLTAVIVSGPLLKLAIPVPGWKETLGKIFSKILPWFSMDNEIDTAFLSHDPQVAPLYEKDPLVNRRVSSRWFTEAVDAMANVQRRAVQWPTTLPLLMMHGGDDKLTNPEGSKTFFDNCSASDKTLKIYDGLYHEIFNELKYKEILADMETWLKERNL